MSEFKIGDEITCVDNLGLPEELTLGKNYIVTGFSVSAGINLVNLFNDEGIEASFYGSRFILASEIEDSVTPTKIMVEITQDEYDTMYDRIELLESLLVDANKRIEDLEYSHDVRNNPLIMEFFRLTRLVSANREIAGLIGVEFGDNIVDKVCDYLVQQCQK